MQTINMFSGRIGVKDFWKSLVVLFFMIIGAALMYALVAVVGLMLSIKSATAPTDVFPTALILMLIPGLILPAIILQFTVSLQVRRLHDLNLSGWWLVGWWLVNLVAGFFVKLASTESHQMLALGVGVLLTMVFLVASLWPGNAGTNKYGSPEQYTSLSTLLKGNQPTSFLKRLGITLLILLILIGARMASNAFLKRVVPEKAGSSSVQNAADEEVPVGVYVTPKGAATLKPPTNWQPQVLLDSKVIASVNFVGPGQARLSVALAASRGEKVSADFLKERALKSFKNTTYSQSLILEEKSVTINGATGYMVEGKVSAKEAEVLYKRVYVVDAVKGVYVINVQDSEKYWNETAPLIEDAVQTLQVK